MRKLMWFALGFAAACALCVYLWLTGNLLLPLVSAAALFMVSLSLCSRYKQLRCVAAVCLGCIVGFLWFRFYSANYLSPAAQLDEKKVETSAFCTDYSYETPYGAAVEGILMREKKVFRVKFYLNDKQNLQPGDEITSTFQYRVTTPDGADEPTAHRGKGIFLLAYQKGEIQIKKSEEQPLWAFPARLRHALLGMLDAAFPKDTASFAKALLLGDRTGIDYQTNTAFKLSGISHVIAVSGLHVTILFTLINALVFKRRWLAAIIGIPVLLLFAAVAGFSPSITRACIMQCLMILATLLNKEYDGPTELAASCLVMLVVNPLVITSVSFQLSIGCMIGIFLFNGRISGYLTGKFLGKKKRFFKVKRWIISSVSVTLSAMTLTTPLVAIYFDTVSLVGVLTNLLTLWIISFIFYGIMLVCLLGAIWPAAASAIAAVISWPIRYVLWVSGILAAFPLSAVYTVSIYIVLWLVFCYVLLAVFFGQQNEKACCAGLLCGDRTLFVPCCILAGTADG